jgi:hypothetical protein
MNKGICGSSSAYEKKSMNRIKWGYQHCKWETKNCKEKPILLKRISSFSIGYNFAIIEKYLWRTLYFLVSAILLWIAWEIVSIYLYSQDPLVLIFGSIYIGAIFWIIWVLNEK